ncbi:MAG: hypothetical protein J6Y72_10665 [Bacteroidales bacterium]|nr:hypothetical protein [Bacteroidales bacterium]
MKNKLLNFVVHGVLTLTLIFVACDKDDEENKSGGVYEINGHEAVDLGLPSGLLWATCNVGAPSSENIGGYYAWGETETKQAYWDGNYKHFVIVNSEDADKGVVGYGYTKYCHNRGQGYDGYTDKLTTLEAVDDAASVNWGGKWRMPTDTEWEELKNNTIRTWVRNYNNTEINGYLFASRNNKESIFIPAAGYRYGSYSSDTTCLYYWSSTLGYAYSDNAHCFEIHSDYLHKEKGYDSRENGLPIRPVCPAE